MFLKYCQTFMKKGKKSIRAIKTCSSLHPLGRSDIFVDSIKISSQAQAQVHHHHNPLTTAFILVVELPRTV